MKENGIIFSRYVKLRHFTELIQSDITAAKKKDLQFSMDSTCHNSHS